MNKLEVERDIDHYGDIESVTRTKGGKVIIDELKEGVITIIDELSRYSELSHTELIASCAKLSEKIYMLRVFQNAETNKKLAKKELEEILKTEIEEVE